MEIRRLVPLAVATALFAGLLGACSDSGCNFIADGPRLAADVRGEPTPRAALRLWLDGDDHTGPDDGWTRSGGGADAALVEFRSGNWTVGVIPAPAGGYLVNSVGCSER